MSKPQIFFWIVSSLAAFFWGWAAYIYHQGVKHSSGDAGMADAVLTFFLGIIAFVLTIVAIILFYTGNKRAI